MFLAQATAKSNTTLLVELQAGLALLTILVLLVSSYFTIRMARRQAYELRRTIQSNAHATVLNRLLDLYRIQLESDPRLDDDRSRNDLSIYAMLDFLYYLYLERDTLSPQYSEVWQSWAMRATSLPDFSDVFARIQSEFPTEFVAALTTQPANRRTTPSFR
jgi:hypothetical protein